MSDTTGALAFLVRRTIRNRIAKQLSRVRSPRYAVALLIGLGYMWLVFLRPGGSLNRSPGGAAGPAAGIGMVAGVGLAITVIMWWLKGGVSSALAFQPAEVQLLFSAPLTRRALIAYKIARSQILLLVNALLWVLLMRRWGVVLPVPMRFVTAWGFFSVLSLHRLGAALVQTPPVTGPRRLIRTAAMTLAAAAALALLAGVAPAIARFGSLGAQEGLRAIGATLGEPPASWALAPFRLVTAPIYTRSVLEWAGAFSIVAVLVVLHLLWVFSMDVEFEEAAATATTEVAGRIAAFKARRAGGAVVVTKQKAGGLRTRLPLAPLGWPATAIAWKNTLALLRTGSLRLAIMIVVIVFVTSRIVGASEHNSAGAATAIPYLGVAGMTLILGPRMVRNDLRQDLLSLALLKSYPLRGAAVVAAEMASPTLVLTAFQVLLVMAGFISIPAGARGEALGGLTAVVVAAPFGMLALNAVGVGIQNGLALLFPSWVRLGPDSGGIEAIGQNILVMIGSLLALVIALILPAAAGVVVRVISVPSLGSGSIGLAVAVGTVVLAAEVAALVVLLGKTFERIDPTALS